MVLYGKVKVKDLGEHVLVQDNNFSYHIFKKIDEWVLRSKKMNGSFEVPSQVYETLWVKGYQIL